MFKLDNDFINSNSVETLKLKDSTLQILTSAVEQLKSDTRFLKWKKNYLIMDFTLATLIINSACSIMNCNQKDLSFMCDGILPYSLINRISSSKTELRTDPNDVEYFDNEISLHKDSYDKLILFAEDFIETYLKLRPLNTDNPNEHAERNI